MYLILNVSQFLFLFVSMSIIFEPLNGKNGLVTQGSGFGCLPASITNLIRSISDNFSNVLVFFDSNKTEFKENNTFNLMALTEEVGLLQRTNEITGEVLEADMDPPFGLTGLDLQYIIVFFRHELIRSQFGISAFQVFECNTFQEFEENHQNLSESFIGTIVLYKKRCKNRELVDHYITILHKGNDWYKLDSNTQTVKFKVACFNNILTKGKEIVPIRYFQFYG